MKEYGNENSTCPSDTEIEIVCIQGPEGPPGPAGEVGSLATRGLQGSPGPVGLADLIGSRGIAGSSALQNDTIQDRKNEIH